MHHFTGFQRFKKHAGGIVLKGVLWVVVVVVVWQPLEQRSLSFQPEAPKDLTALSVVGHEVMRQLINGRHWPTAACWEQ